MTPTEERAKPDQAADEQNCRPVFPCTYCGADTRQDKVKAAFWAERGLVAVEDIPARVCEGCGEQFYDDEIAQRIERIVNGSCAAPGREIVVPVFSLAEAE